MSIFWESMICFLIEVISFVLCYLLIKKMKVKHKYSILLFFFLAVVLQAVWWIIFPQSGNLAFVFGLLFPFFCKDRKKIEVYVFFFLVALIEGLSYGLGVYATALFKGYELQGINGSGEHIVCLLPFPFCICVYFMIQKYLIRGKVGLFFGKEQKITLFIALFCSIACLSLHVRMVLGNENQAQRLLIAGAMFICIIIIYLITTIWQGQAMWKNQQLLQKQTMYNYLTKSQQQYIDFVIKRDDELRRFRHDFRAHMIIMRSIAEKGNAEEVLSYINEVDELTQRNEAQHFTGNSTVDAILNDLKNRMDKSNVAFCVNGRMQVEEENKIFDISICIYNILLNAIEAVEKLEPEDRIIQVDIKQYQKKIYFNIKNKCEIKENWEGVTELTTSKPDKENHGIGSKNVEQIAQKNNGKVLYSVKDSWFITELLI